MSLSLPPAIGDTLASGAAALRGDRLDVLRLEEADVAWVESSPADIGRPEDAFDGNVATLMRSAAVNPAEITVTFSRPVTLRGFTTHVSHAFGDPAYRWKVEGASTHDDLELRAGSFAELVGWTPTASDRSSEVTLASPARLRVVRLTVERLTGDAFVHIDEWEMFGQGAFGLLDEARGVAIDGTGRTLVAESGADRIDVFGPSGGLLFRFGSSGSEPGAFDRPWDLAVGPTGRIYVVDRGNDRIQVFDAGGRPLSRFGGSGDLPGQFDDPQGIDVAGGRVYVADTGNQRVQRFFTDGTIDPRWGTGGVVGATGAVRRDHAGFDGPTDVAANPVGGDLYVADHGNQRLEVFDAGGGYVRTFLAVYRPNALAFEPDGDLLIAGEDPNDAYPAFDGRVRRLRAGEELIGEHFTGGLDDIGRIQGGVAARPGGGMVFSDVLRGRLIAAPSFRAPALSDLRIDAHGTSVTFRWRTQLPSVGRVVVGLAPFEGSTFSESTRGIDHLVRVTGLSPNTRRFYRVSFTDPFDRTRRFTRTDVLNTGTLQGRTAFLRLKAVGVIYTDTDAEPGFVRMDPTLLRDARTRFRRASEFYWRNSGFRLWPDIEIVEVDRDIVGSVDPNAEMEADLAALGFGPQDDLDAAWGTSVLAPGNFGGGGTLFGRFVARSAWTTQSDFVAIHEINHSVDSLYAKSGLGKYEFNHGIWAVPNGVGNDFSINGQILRNFFPVNYTAVLPPFTKILTAADSDGDNVPDASPVTVRRGLSLTEATIGSSASSRDTDGDGLSDFEEATALPFHGTDPTDRDTDGDGTVDGVDLNPAYRMNERIRKGTPTVDGVIGTREPWTIVTKQWGFSNDALVADTDALQDRVTTYGAWDSRFLYLALRGPASITRVALDGGADNRFIGPDNYLLDVGNGARSLTVKDNVGVPDVFRQIDDDGQFSEFFDTDPQFTLPYEGRAILDRPGEGLGFPGRLVTEADILYRRGGTGNASVWEIAIPWSNVTGFRGGTGKRMAIGVEVDGDRLFETDRDAVIRLIAAG